MSRQAYVRLIFVVVMLTTGLACSGDNSHGEAACSDDDTEGEAGVSSQALPDRPNIVFVMVDDLDELVSPYWDALPLTESLIGDRCMAFENAFVTDPICCPSRASILTGNYPHTTGVFDNTAPDGGASTFVSAAENDTVATRLQAAGYSTAFFGKYLNGYERMLEHVPPGWDEWFGLGEGLYEGFSYTANHNGEEERYGDRPEDYQTDVLAGQATEYIESREDDDDRPFVAFVWPSAPHSPITAAPRHRQNEFNDDDIPSRANFDEADVGDKPTWLREGYPALASRERRMGTLVDDYRNRMGSLLAVDDMIGAIVEALTSNDELDNTILIVSSDNGYSFGGHRVAGKVVPYEESIRVPLVVAGPGVSRGSTDAFALNIDIAPTLLDLADLPHGDLDGTSLLPLLGGSAPTSAWRTDFLLEYEGTYTGRGPGRPLVTLDDVEEQLRSGGTIAPPTYRALRTTQYLYVEWYGGDRHEYELYDLTQDPYQLDNLVASTAGARQHETKTAELQARLETLKACRAESCRS